MQRGPLVIGGHCGRISDQPYRRTYIIYAALVAMARESRRRQVPSLAEWRRASARLSVAIQMAFYFRINVCI